MPADGAEEQSEHGRLRICIVSDFFYPNDGGVETHIIQLATNLAANHHKVVVATHAYGDRHGVRYMQPGFKVYYLPTPVFYNQCTLPSVYGCMGLLRQLFIRERIQIVHAHQAFSTMGNEAMALAPAMGLKAVFTDHSLFGFCDASAIITNKIYKFTLKNTSQIICVSHTSKENTCLRARASPSKISVIPNAVDTVKFVPSLPRVRKPQDRVTIVVMSRLVYRKGVDLLVPLIPQVCKRYPQVDFIIGGDGPKRIDLEQMREAAGLESRITMLGSVPHHLVRDTLVKGDIFLNCSLTEAFCMAILEAASCGLLVVSSNVGGVPEVLPPGMAILADASTAALLTAIDQAMAKYHLVDGRLFHDKIKSMYDWKATTLRTEAVYRKAMDMPQLTIADTLARVYDCGPVSGKAFAIVIIFLHAYLCLLEWMTPAAQIDRAVDWTKRRARAC